MSPADLRHAAVSHGAAFRCKAKISTHQQTHTPATLISLVSCRRILPSFPLAELLRRPQRSARSPDPIESFHIIAVEICPAECLFHSPAFKTRVPDGAL